MWMAPDKCASAMSLGKMFSSVYSPKTVWPALLIVAWAVLSSIFGFDESGYFVDGHADPGKFVAVILVALFHQNAVDNFPDKRCSEVFGF